MGCGQSTSKASSAPAYVLPRPTRRASVNGAPPPPEYYNTEPTTAGSSRSVSAHTNQSASAGAGNDQAAARRLTLIPDANTAKAMAEVGQQTNKKDDKVSLSEVVMREKKAANKGAGDKGASELGLKHVASVSMVGLDVSKKKKRNQDGFFADACFTDPKTGFFVVFDGHGQSGDMVAEYLMTKLPDMLRKELPGARGSKTSLAKMLKSAFLETNSHLNSTPIDTSLSGSTCCSVLLLDNAIVTANVGDSRCIAAYKSTSGDTVKYTAKALTIDHKPDLPQEKARIIGRGGRVAPWAGSDLDHIYRVWLRDEDTPGIAMSRSFGDKVAAQVGIIAEPELQHFERTPDLSFMLIASDGVWEFMDDQECVEFIDTEMTTGKRSFYEAVDALVIECNERWLQNEGTVDDITVLGLVFDQSL